MNQRIGRASKFLVLAAVIVAGTSVFGCGDMEGGSDERRALEDEASDPGSEPAASGTPSDPRTAVEDPASEASDDSDSDLVSSFENEVVVDGVFTLRWDSSSPDWLRAQMSAPTTGWIAVGFDPAVAMANANIIIGFIEGGSAKARDDWGVSAFDHSEDRSLPSGTSDVFDVSGVFDAATGVSRISFRIPRNPTDRYDTVLAPGRHRVILGYGQDGARDFESYHAWRGATDIIL